MTKICHIFLDPRDSSVLVFGWQFLAFSTGHLPTGHSNLVKSCQVWWYVPEECRQDITVQESRRLFAKEGLDRKLRLPVWRHVIGFCSCFDHTTCFFNQTDKRKWTVTTWFNICPLYVHYISIWFTFTFRYVFFCSRRGRRESRRDFERRVDLFVAWLSHRQEKAGEGGVERWK